MVKSKGNKFNEQRNITDSDVSLNPKDAIKILDAIIYLTSK